MSESVTDSKQLPEGAPDDPLTGHDYDGIQEYDNPASRLVEVVVRRLDSVRAALLLLVPQRCRRAVASDRFDRAMAANLQLQFAEIGELTANRENVVKFLHEDSWLQIGKAVFRSNCVSCHGKEGGGLVGPNLCDDSYKNVKDIGDILTVLQKGANAGAMPAWNNRLSTNEMVLVASYVASLRGSDPAVAKAAGGSRIDPWPAAPAETGRSENRRIRRKPPRRLPTKPALAKPWNRKPDSRYVFKHGRHSCRRFITHCASSDHAVRGTSLNDHELASKHGTEFPSQLRP